MSELSLNPSVKQKKEILPEAVETGGSIASANTNTPSPLFNAVPSVETSGSIASSSSSNGSSANFVC